MKLFRAHGLGNDYLVLESGGPLRPELVRQLCDRHRGVGGDGILEPTPGGRADHGVRIWNPDGSVAEKSGNGLRIYAWWLVERAGSDRTLSVWTGHEVVGCEVRGTEVAIEMGNAEVGDPEDLEVEGTVLRFVPVDLGNPHAVVFRDEALDTLPWRSWGAALEVHPRFPARTNVQIASADLEIRIWERGAGETLASGSSACAVAAAAVATGRKAPGRHTLSMPGGTLVVTVRPDFSVRLEGPVEPIGVVEVAEAWLQARGGAP